MDEVLRTLPLFPLHVTLFPGGVLPLHVFEPRYRAMIHGCLADDRRFGVVLIEEGAEVGAPAVPHLTGTVAVIGAMEALDDGRFTLMVYGEQRFHIERTWGDPAGFLVGQVRRRPDIMDEEPAALAPSMHELRTLMVAYASRVMGDDSSLGEEVARMEDPVQLTGMAASLVPASHARKQRILEVDSVSERLRRMRMLLRDELLLLAMLARPTNAVLERGVISPN